MVITLSTNISADFGDVLTFDTTYRTNRYSMPLAMFVGFNNQLQNIVFAEALIRDEKAGTFEWVFEQFITCMCGKEPITIFTGKITLSLSLSLSLSGITDTSCNYHTHIENYLE